MNVILIMIIVRCMVVGAAVVSTYDVDVAFNHHARGLQLSNMKKLWRLASRIEVTEEVSRVVKHGIAALLHR